MICARHLYKYVVQLRCVTVLCNIIVQINCANKLYKYLAHYLIPSIFSPKPDFRKQTKFDRVHTVKLDKDQFMICSCGYMKQYLAPCRHFMAVLDDRKYLTPDLFHIRWWKHFNYYFASGENSSIASTTSEKLKEIQNKMNDTLFDYKGNYRGCHMKDHDFVNVPHTIDEHSKHAVIMNAINEFNLAEGPLIQNDNALLKYLPGETTMEVHDGMNEHGFTSILFDDQEIQGGVSIVPTEDFAVGTQSEGFLSQRSLEYEALMSNSEEKHKKGDDLYNLVESTISTIRTVEQRNKFVAFLREFSAANVSNNNPNYANGKHGTTMLGSDESGRPESSKRRRQFYERI